MLFNAMFSEDDVRYLILNAEKIKQNKCSDCDGTGHQNWNDDGEDIKPGKLDSYNENRVDGPCESCQGIGYTDVFQFVNEEQ